MMKRILLSLALAASLGGAVVACNTPSSTTAPSVTTTTTTSAPASVGTDAGSPAASDAVPSSS